MNRRLRLAKTNIKVENKAYVKVGVFCGLSMNFKLDQSQLLG